MAKKNGDTDVLRCSFCNKDQNDVRKLIAGPDRLHLRRVRRGLQRHHRRRQPPRAEDPAVDAADAARDQEVPRRLRHRPGPHQEEARRRRLQPLQAHRDPEGVARAARHRADQGQHPAGRPDGHGQDAAGPDAGQDAVGPLRHRRRHDADRGRVRRRGRREHHPEAAAGGRRRHREVPAGDHLHRRDRQDLAQGREPVDHARRLGRRRPAGPAQDPRGHRRQRAAPGRAQAPAPGVLPGRHDQHPLHLRRRVRRPGQDHRPPHREEDDGLPVRSRPAPVGGARRDARAAGAGGPDPVRPHPRVRRPPARGRARSTTSTRRRSSRS